MALCALAPGASRGQSASPPAAAYRQVLGLEWVLMGAAIPLVRSDLDAPAPTSGHAGLRRVARHYYGLTSNTKALRYFEKSRVALVAALGERHPEHAAALVHLVHVRRRLNRGDRSRADLDLALAILSETAARFRAGDVLEQAAILHDKAVVHVMLDDPDTAATLLRRSVELRKAKAGAAHPLYAASLHDLALVELSASLRSGLQRGTLDDPVARLESALAIRQAAAASPGDVVLSLSSLSAARLLQNRIAEATVLTNRSLELARTQLGEHHPIHMSVLTNLALSGHGPSLESIAAAHQAALAGLAHLLPP